jgi:uncharacterized membrane protein YkvA (DUF1232 family)
MPLKIAFELSDADLEFFRGALRDVKTKIHSQEERAIIASASRLARQTAARPLSGFIQDRLKQLDTLIRMLEDAEWRLEGRHRERVLGALAYFAEPVDLIPDQIPGFGFLDDAIMVELVVQDLRPELDAYADFCRFREEQERVAEQDPEQRAARLERRRRAMYRRIDARRERRERRGGSLFMLS